MARMEFGYHPPSGDRGIEIIRERDYLSDFKKAMDVAAQSFKSVWISDHLAYSNEFRLECWTHLTWVAAQYPNVDLGTIVMCNSWRQPSLMAKMAMSLHWMSGGRLILGYGAGWFEGEYKRLRLRLPLAAHPRRDGGRGRPDHEGDVGSRPGHLRGAVLQGRERLLRAALRDPADPDAGHVRRAAGRWAWWRVTPTGGTPAPARSTSCARSWTR